MAWAASTADLAGMAFPANESVIGPDVIVFPESIKLGDSTVVVPPVVGAEMSVAKDCHRSF